MNFLTWTIAFDVFIHKNTQIMPFNIKKREVLVLQAPVCVCMCIHHVGARVFKGVHVYHNNVHVCVCVYVHPPVGECAQNRCHYVTLCACICVSVCVKACVNGRCTLCTTSKMKVFVCIWCVRWHEVYCLLGCVLCCMTCVLCVVCCVLCVVCCVLCVVCCATVCWVLHARCHAVLCAQTAQCCAACESESFLLIFFESFYINSQTHTQLHTQSSEC